MHVSEARQTETGKSSIWLAPASVEQSAGGQPRARQRAARRQRGSSKQALQSLAQDVGWQRQAAHEPTGGESHEVSCRGDGASAHAVMPACPDAPAIGETEPAAPPSVAVCPA